MEHETMNVLNVAALEPKLKHPTVFRMFDQLAGGESFILHNDHDPKPLYYQLLGERGDVFTWEYMEAGPEAWTIKISRNLKDHEETIGEMVAGDYRKALVFKKYGIDFCCKGNRSLGTVCADKNIDQGQVERELEDLGGVTNLRPLNYKSWPLDFLTDYIVNTHHGYVRETMPVIKELAEKVAARHGSQNEELKKISDIFLNITLELNSHMLKEERILFPRVKELISMNADKNKGLSSFGYVTQPINLMEQEHEAVGSDMAQIRNLSGNYQLPEGACASWNLLYKLLEEFENDLHLHIHLENNILFPAAVKLE